MKQKMFKFVSVLIVLAMALGMFGLTTVNAAGARSLSWAVSVTYLNVDVSDADIHIDFYAAGSATAIPFTPPALPSGAAASFYIGSVSGIGSTFQGNAVISSSASLVATVVQFHNNAAGETVKMRMLSNGFTSGSESENFMIPTTLWATDRTTVFSIQNTEAETITATVNFVAASTGTVVSTKNFDIPANSSKYIYLDTAADTGLTGTSFDGSATISAVKKASGTPAKVVSSISELYNTKNVGANFEGMAAVLASQTVYMPTGLCAPNTPSGLQTYYAIQNAGSASTNITVTYYNTAGTLVTTDGPYTIGQGQKKSIITCAPNSGYNMTGFTGSAIITSSASKIVAIGKAQPAVGSGAGVADFYSIFVGQPAGYSKLALPFVRWATDADYNAASNYGGYQRTYLAIQNVGDTSALVDVKYMDKSGNVIATHTLTIGAKAKGTSYASIAGALGTGVGGSPVGNLKAGAFGYYTDGTAGGGVMVQANAANPTAKFIAIARSQNPGAGEDYNGMEVTVP